AHSKAANLRQDYVSVVQRGAVAILLVGEGVVAPAALEAWKADRLARLHPAEERLIGVVQAGEHILQDMAVESGVVGTLRPDILQLGCLLEAGRHFALPATPPGDPLLQGRVVEQTAMPQNLLQRLFLRRRRLEVLFERLEVGLLACQSGERLVHTLPFCS